MQTKINQLLSSYYFLPFDCVLNCGFSQKLPVKSSGHLHLILVRSLEYIQLPPFKQLFFFWKGSHDGPNSQCSPLI